MPETMKLVGITKTNLTKNENGENLSHLEITEVARIHCNIVKNKCQQNSRVMYTFVIFFTKVIRSIIKYFTERFYVFNNFWHIIFIY